MQSSNNNRRKSNKDFELTASTTDSAVFEQIYRNAIAGKTGELVDTLLPPSRWIFRGYRVLNRDPWSFEPVDIAVFDLFMDTFDIDPRLEQIFEKERPDWPIYALDPANDNRLIALDRRHKYRGATVFQIVNLYEQREYRIKPGLLQSLQPVPVSEMVEGTKIINVGELPSSGNYYYPPISDILKQANTRAKLADPVSENTHADYVAMGFPPGKTCPHYNCPICRHVETFLKVFEEMQFLNPTVKFWLSEPLTSERVRDYDELLFLQSTLQTTGLLLQQASILSNMSALQENPKLGQNKEYMERMTRDYQMLVDMLYDDKVEAKE